MTSKPIWTDTTEANYRKWHVEHYGVEPPEVKMKEVTMADSKTGDTSFIPQPTTGGNEKIGKFMGTVVPNPASLYIPGATLTAEGIIGAKPKRHRRSKGTVPGIEVITTHTAIIPLYIPERPKGMDKVNIKITGDTGLTLMIEWPEGITALKAIEAHFANQKGA